jgi:hypothetical protein
MENEEEEEVGREEGEEVEDEDEDEDEENTQQWKCRRKKIKSPCHTHESNVLRINLTCYEAP